jgi:hypothetical protein
MRKILTDAAAIGKASFPFFLARFSPPALTLAVPLALPDVGLAGRSVSWSKLCKA